MFKNCGGFATSVAPEQPCLSAVQRDALPLLVCPSHAAATDSPIEITDKARYPIHTIMKHAVLACISTLLITGSAHAADLPRQAIAAAPVSNWTGFYAGVNAGGGWYDGGTRYPKGDLIVSGYNAIGIMTNRDPVRASGALGGFQAGYNYRLRPRWVIGAEVDFQLADIGGSGGNHYAPGITTSASQTIQSFGTVRARLGHLAAENLLVYATGGFAFARINNSARFDVGPGVTSVGSFNINGVTYTSLCGNPDPNVCYTGSSGGLTPGWTIGGGLEYALGQHWSLKGEYLYARFDKTLTAVAVTTQPGTSPITYPARFTTDLNIVRAGLNYRF